MKFFGYALGVQTLIDAKTGRHIINGRHDVKTLQETLDSFVQTFVLCNACMNPETELRVTRQGVLCQCKACGHCSKIDSKHKLAKYILTNPPAAKGKA